MNTLDNLLLVVLWNLLLPILIGYLCTNFMNLKYKDNLALNFAIGFIIMLGIFQPITLVAIYLKSSLTFLTNTIKIIWLILGGVSIVLNARRFIGNMKRLPDWMRKFHILIAVAALLFCFQAYVYIGYQHIDDDDAFYVATATTAVANDNLYVMSPYSGDRYSEPPERYIISPFSIFYAVLSKLTDIHPTVYAHLYLPFVLLLFVYLVYYLWGKEWFDNSKSIGMFLILLCTLNIFGNYSSFTTQSFFLLRLWQGKAFLAAGMLPFVLYIVYKISKEESSVGLLAVLLLTASATGLVSSMGIFLTPILIGSFAIIDFIQSKSVRRVFNYLVCCFPCIVYGGIYLIIS